MPTRREVDLLAGSQRRRDVDCGPIAAIDAFDEQLRGDTIVGDWTPDRSSPPWSMSCCRATSPWSREIEGEVDHLDDLALRGQDSDRFLPRGATFGGGSPTCAAAAAPVREAFSPLVRPDFTLDERIEVPWLHLLDRLERLIDGTENARELLVGLFDVYLGGVAQRANDVMKALIAPSAVLLLSVVSGLVSWA